MFRSLDAIMSSVVEKNAHMRLAVAACAESHALMAALEARDIGLVVPYLVGDMEKAAAIAQEHGKDLDGCTLVHEENPNEAAKMAVTAVQQGDADVLMKGLINTDDFLRAVLNRRTGIASGGVLSHVAVCALPDMSSASFLGAPVTCRSANDSRLVCVTDCAMNISPNLQRKLEIVRNALGVVRGLGLGTPYVAMLAATEKVMLPAMPATLDAQLIARMADQGEFGDDVLVAGPMALDVAVSANVAERKGIHDPVAGRANILCAPDIESGNILYKALTTLLCTEMAGVLVGTTAPVVMSSRGDTQRTKLLSIALAAHLASV
ncbi:MAG: phosphate acyltransferase [Pseudomonadota bacterium]